MKSDNFRILREIKEFIFSLDTILVHFPKGEKVLKDNIYDVSYSILEEVIFANLLADKQLVQKRIIARLSMLDFYFELAYRKKYISEKKCIHFCKKLQNITKMTYGWIKNG